jgi:hypothetical protein
MTIEKSAYLTVLNNKLVYDRTFKSIESNNKYTRFFTQNNIQVNGRAVEYLLTWPKEGLDWENDLSIYKPDNQFKRKVNAIPFRLGRLLDKVYYEVVNEERFEEALESEATCKDFTKNLLEQTADKVNIDLEVAIPNLICNDANFTENNLLEKNQEFWQDPIQILQELFNASDILEKWSQQFNKGYPEDPDDKSSDYIPLETNSRKKIVLLDSKVRNTILVGGYKENVNFPALDLEKRFGSENVLVDNLPNNYGMLVLDERCLQLYKRAKKEGFRHQEEASNGNQWFFLNPVIHGGFITAFNALAWKFPASEAETEENEETF